jgi:geranylgeranyl reductase family protein
MTTHSDVLVVGAGPAGSAAARALAQAGLDVLLADRCSFPRDKACGDALIPDALAALRRLGLHDAALGGARRLDALDIYAPGGRRVRLAGPAACLPRSAFDEVLRQGALSAGARFLGRHLLAAPIESGGAVRGAVMCDLASGREVRIEAALTVLATGAAAGPLQLFGMCERAAPSAMAGRVYVQADAALASELDALCISYDRAICPGYGWLFPGPDGVVNLGVGFFNDGPPPTTRNLQRLLERFVAVFPPAARLWSRARPLGRMKGAPLRTGLRGARLHRPGLLVTGEAAGLTYAFSGEGIGKAIEGALMAAEVATRALADGAPASPEVGARYQSGLRAAFGERFRAYDLVQRRLAHPRLADLLVARARPGSYAQRELEAVFNETSAPRALFSPWGLLRALVG